MDLCQSGEMDLLSVCQETQREYQDLLSSFLQCIQALEVTVLTSESRFWRGLDGTMTFFQGVLQQQKEHFYPL